jgi:hypothetical protein
MTIFDFLTILHNKSKSWDDLELSEQKEFSPYMITKWLSMDRDYCEVVNELQQYTIGILDKKMVFTLYSELLPFRKKYFVKYIKGDKKDKYNPELLIILREYFEESKKNIINILNLIFITNTKKSILENVLKKYGKTDKEIKTLLKIKK